MARRYTEDERATALAALTANGGNLSRTARVLNVPRTTLKRWHAAMATESPALAELRQEKKTALASILEGIVHALLDEAAKPAKMAAANLRDLVVASGIAVDKMILLRESTESLSDDERAARVKALLERARGRRERRAAETGITNGPAQGNQP